MEPEIEYHEYTYDDDRVLFVISFTFLIMLPRQLGYSSANSSHCCAHFTHGTGNIHLDDLACSGVEASVRDCPHRGWGEHNCAHTEDASVTCNGKGINSAPGININPVNIHIQLGEVVRV